MAATPRRVRVSKTESGSIESASNIPTENQSERNQPEMAEEESVANSLIDDDKIVWRRVRPRQPELTEAAIEALRKEAKIPDARVTSLAVSADSTKFKGKVYLPEGGSKVVIALTGIGERKARDEAKKSKAKKTKATSKPKEKDAPKSAKAPAKSKKSKPTQKATPKIAEEKEFVKDYHWLDVVDFHLAISTENPTFDPRVLRRFKQPIVDSIKRKGIMKPVEYVTLPAKKGSWPKGRYTTEGRQRIINALEAISQQAEEHLGVEIPRGEHPDRDENFRAIRELMPKIRELWKSGKCREIRVKAQEVPVESEHALEAYERGNIANAHRSSDTQFEQAFKMKFAIDKGQSIEQVAADFDVTVKTVKNRLMLLEVPDEIVDLVLEDKITVSDLHTVRKEKKTPEARVKYAKTIAEGRQDGSWKPRAKKSQAGKAPKAKDLRKVANSMSGFGQVRDVLLWASGDVTAKTLLKRQPHLQEAFAESGLIKSPKSKKSSKTESEATGKVSGVSNIRLRFKSIEDPSAKTQQKVCKSQDEALSWVREKLGDGPLRPSGPKGNVIINKSQTLSVTVGGDVAIAELLQKLND